MSTKWRKLMKSGEEEKSGTPVPVFQLLTVPFLLLSKRVWLHWNKHDEQFSLDVRLLSSGVVHPKSTFDEHFENGVKDVNWEALKCGEVHNYPHVLTFLENQRAMAETKVSVYSSSDFNGKAWHAFVGEVAYAVKTLFGTTLYNFKTQLQCGIQISPTSQLATKGMQIEFIPHIQGLYYDFALNNIVLILRLTFNSLITRYMSSYFRWLSPFLTHSIIFFSGRWSIRNRWRLVVPQPYLQPDERTSYLSYVGYEVLQDTLWRVSEEYVKHAVIPAGWELVDSLLLGLWGGILNPLEVMAKRQAKWAHTTFSELYSGSYLAIIQAFCSTWITGFVYDALL